MSGLALKPVLDKPERLTDEPATRLAPSGLGTIWVDLDNSPHVPFFSPIIRELERAGYKVLLTARDCFQVCDLADLHGLSYQRIGHHYGKNTALKLFGLGWRALQLVPTALREKPILVLSHGSRSQLLAANLLRIPSVTIADYEFARIWMLVRPTWVITPEVISDKAIHGRPDHVLKYPGIKEDVYVPSFKPDPKFLTDLGLNPTDLIVTIRPPATEAHYHRPESDQLFQGVLDFLGEQPRVRMILLPRNERQAADIRAKWAPLFESGAILIPSQVVDGLNLIWHSDLVISGGGTMNREAAALGVPVYSIFRGTIGAVDRYLAGAGRLILIEDVQEIPKKLVLAKRTRSSTPLTANTSTLSAIVEHIVTILQGCGKRTHSNHGNHSYHR